MLMLLHPKTRLSTCKQSLFPCLLSITLILYLPPSPDYLSNTFPYSVLFPCLLSITSNTIPCFKSLLPVNHCHNLTFFCYSLPKLYLLYVFASCQALSLPCFALSNTANTIPSSMYLLLSITVIIPFLCFCFHLGIIYRS